MPPLLLLDLNRPLLSHVPSALRCLLPPSRLRPDAFAVVRDARPRHGGQFGGTLCQLQVTQTSTTATDRFRFTLGLSAESANQDLPPTAAQFSAGAPAVRFGTPGESADDDPRTAHLHDRQRQRPTPASRERSVTRRLRHLINAASTSPGASLHGFTSLAANGMRKQSRPS